MNTILINDHGIQAGDFRDTTLKLRLLLDSLRGTKNLTLRFLPGEYHFYPDYAAEHCLCISNHDEDTLKRVAMDLSHFEGLVLDGGGASFICHTDIIPFFLQDARDVVLQNFSVDYAVPGYSEGELLEIDKYRCVIGIDQSLYPCFVENQLLWFPRSCGIDPLYRWLEMDSGRYAPVPNVGDMSFTSGKDRFGANVIWTDLGEGRFEAVIAKDTPDALCFPTSGKKGNRLILRHHFRTHPGFYAMDCQNLCYRNINVYHCVGMAAQFERTRDIELDAFNVCLREKDRRVFTATADATHFIYCSGTIHLHHCLFENQLDDPLNIHGIYVRLDRVLPDGSLLCEWVHNQQKGVCIGQKGDRIRIVNNRTMLPVWEGHLKETLHLNKDYLRILLDEPLDAPIQEGFVVENIDLSMPDVLIEHCTFRNNRARGLLLTSAGKVRVENNLFETPGAAILVEGDSNHWFESGETNDILITKNRFINCSYVHCWGKAPIQVTPSAPEMTDDRRYHRLLQVVDNEFTCIDERLVFARNLEKLVFTGNKITRSQAYPAIGDTAFMLEGVNQFITDME